MSSSSGDAGNGGYGGKLEIDIPNWSGSRLVVKPKKWLGYPCRRGGARRHRVAAGSGVGNRGYGDKPEINIPD